MTRKHVYYAAVKIRDLYWRIFRPRTLGSRVIVVDDGKVLLVKHTYMSGWHLPGGGLKRGETFAEAAQRELREECGLIADDPRLLQVYYSRRQPKADYIAVYLIEDHRSDPTFQQGPEIEEAKYFPFNDLPADASLGTQRRIFELQAGKFDTIW